MVGESESSVLFSLSIGRSENDGRGLGNEEPMVGRRETVGE